MHPIAEILLVLTGAFAVLVAVPAVVIHTMRGGVRRTDQEIEEILSATRTDSGDPDEPRVRIRFHVYHGVLIWARQIAVDFSAPPDIARQALFDLLALKITGLSRYPGAIYVPFLALYEYWAQRRVIERFQQDLK